MYKVLKIIILLAIILFIGRMWFGPHEFHYTVKGKIVALGSNSHEIYIHHETIPGFMDSMTMPFTIDEAEDVSRLHVGDAIQFEYYVKSNEPVSYIKNIHFISESSLNLNYETDFGIQTQLKTNSLVAGDYLPNFTLIDQDQLEQQTNSFRGKNVLLTFIYTSCPVPDFCPLMSSNFRDIFDELNKKKEKDFMLLSVSFDLIRDTPQRLKEYGSLYTKSFDNWKFVTGTKSEIEKLTADFTLFTQVDDDQIIHNLRTVLIDKEGKIVKVWKDNKWDPKEVLEELSRI